MVYGKREKPSMDLPENHTIAIAYKSSDWALIDTELIDFSDLAKSFPGQSEFLKPKKGMLCTLLSQKNRTSIVLGNVHLEWNPLYDHVKFAQAVYFLERAASYMK